MPFCVLGWPPLAFVGKVTVAFLVLTSQAKAQDAPLTASGSNRGFDPWSSTRVPERLEQTAENCWAATGEAARGKAIKAGMSERTAVSLGAICRRMVALPLLRPSS